MGLQITDCSDQLQPCAHSPLCVILMGLRIAKVDEDAVAKIFGYEAAEATYGLRDGLLVAADNFAEVFGVDARR